MIEEKWICNWIECANGAGLASRGECIADPYRIFRYLSDCPEFEPIEKKANYDNYRIFNGRIIP